MSAGYLSEAKGNNHEVREIGFSKKQIPGTIKKSSLIVTLLFPFMISATPNDDLLKAVTANDLTGARKALQAGAKKNGRTEMPREHGENRRLRPTSALIIAAYYGHAPIVKVLIASKANVNARDKDGYTALRAAIKNDETEIINLLKAAGAKE